MKKEKKNRKSQIKEIKHYSNCIRTMTALMCITVVGVSDTTHRHCWTSALRNLSKSIRAHERVLFGAPCWDRKGFKPATRAEGASAKIWGFENEDIKKKKKNSTLYRKFDFQLTSCLTPSRK